MSNLPQTPNSKLQTILVTGGAGYIGSFTVKELLDNGYQVVILDSLENGHEAAVDAALAGSEQGDRGRIHLEIGDVGDKEKVRAVFDKYPIEAVIDFAAYLAVGESMENSQKYFKNNVENFVNLLDVMREKGCRYIIKSSTASTYGDPQDKYFPLEEDYQLEYKPIESCLLEGKWDGEPIRGEKFLQRFLDLYRVRFAGRLELALVADDITRLRIPTSIYGLTKLLDEIILEKYQISNIKYAALRYFNVCGASEDGSMGDDKPVPSNLMTLVILNTMVRTGKLKVFGDDYPTKDGTGLRDYIHPIDLATGHVKALEYLMKKNQSEVFNLGTGNGYTVMEVIKEVERASGCEINYEIVGRRPGDPAVSFADPSKAKKILDWSAKLNLTDMARTAWKWHFTHPEGYEDKK